MTEETFQRWFRVLALLSLFVFNLAAVVAAIDIVRHP